MATSSNKKNQTGRDEQQRRRVSKKDQILSLHMSGMGEVEDLAMITGSRPSYVGSVLQESGMKPGYFDLYTSTAHPMNVYSKFCRSRSSDECLDKSRGTAPRAVNGPHDVRSCALDRQGGGGRNIP